MFITNKMGKMKSTKKIFIIIYILLCLLLCSCSTANTKQLMISPEIYQLTEKEKITNCKIVSLYDYSSIHYNLSSPKLDDAEFEKYYLEQIEGYGEITNELVKEAFDYNTVEEFRTALREQYIEHLKIYQILTTRDEIINKIIENSVFEYDENEVVEFSKRIVYSYENEALMYGYIDVQEYAKDVLGMKLEEFMQKCIDDAKYEIATYLVIGAISYKENITIEQDLEIYEQYQDIENKVFDRFISTDKDF